MKAVYDQSPSPGKKVQNQGKSGSPFKRPPRGGKKDTTPQQNANTEKKGKQAESPAKKAAAVDSEKPSNGTNGKGAKGNGICYTCRDAGQPAEHDYRKCPRAQEKMRKKQERASKKTAPSTSQPTGQRSE